MPLLDLGADVIAKTKAKASVANAKWDAIKTLLNVTKLDHENIQDLAIITALLADGAVTGDKLSDALKAQLGISGGGAVYRGKSYIAAPGTLSNASYGILSNGPDRVAGVKVETNGILRISFSALWKASISDSARAAIFIAGNQLKVPVTHVVAPESEWAQVDGGDHYVPLSTFPAGLLTAISAPTTDATLVNTGTAVGMVSLDSGFDLRFHTTSGAATPNEDAFGGECLVRGLDAGTYNVSVLWLCPGTVTAKNRELTVVSES